MDHLQGPMRNYKRTGDLAQYGTKCQLQSSSWGGRGCHWARFMAQLLALPSPASFPSFPQVLSQVPVLKNNVHTKRSKLAPHKADLQWDTFDYHRKFLEKARGDSKPWRLVCIYTHLYVNYVSKYTRIYLHPQIHTHIGIAVLHQECYWWCGSGERGPWLREASNYAAALYTGRTRHLGLFHSRCWKDSSYSSHKSAGSSGAVEVHPLSAANSLN